MAGNEQRKWQQTSKKGTSHETVAQII